MVWTPTTDETYKDARENIKFKGIKYPKKRKTSPRMGGARVLTLDVELQPRTVLSGGV